MDISDKVLDVIEDNLYKLDTVGLYRFCSDILFKINQLEDDISYSFETLCLFVMEMYEDDVAAIIDGLVNSGFRKWDTLGEFNKICSYRDCVGIYDIGYMYRKYQGRMPSSKKDGLYISIPEDYVMKKVDFVCTPTWDYHLQVTKPFIAYLTTFEHIDKSLWDKLFVAVKDKKNGVTYRNPHNKLYLSSEPNNIRRISYVRIDELDKAVRERDNTGEGIDEWNMRTALPKEILDKYGLKIGDPNIILS